MSVLYVIRHGRTVLDDEKRSDGWLDYPLSDDGRVGLIMAQQYLKMAPIKRVYGNSLRRVHETAHIIASGILSRPEVKVADETRTWNLGVLIGTKKKPNKPVVKYFMTHPDQAPEGGESLDEFDLRFMPWVYARVMEAAQSKEPCLLVTSGSNCRSISRALTDDVDTFDLGEGGLFKLQKTEDGIHGEMIFGHKDDNTEWLS